jgi:hypothetical protein
MKKPAFLLALLVAFSPFVASAAQLYFDPDNGTHGLNETFVVNIRIDNENDCINAAHVEVTYPPHSLRAVDFSRGDSIFTLWAEEPKIDTQRGVVSFSGGVPGGYCGRISGDPAMTNILGKIVFTVIDPSTSAAALHFSPATRVYLNDGKGTEATLHTGGATFAITAATSTGPNPWLQEVAADTIPPDPFDVVIESTHGIFGGNYYLVFSTVDKQTGLDHYEVYDRGSWKAATSPYELQDQILRDVQVKAIDKAGNVTLGTISSTTPPRQVSIFEGLPVWLVIAIFLVIGLLLWLRERRRTVQPPGEAS